jgi:hypothetical protein
MNLRGSQHRDRHQKDKDDSYNYALQLRNIVEPRDQAADYSAPTPVAQAARIILLFLPS